MRKFVLGLLLGWSATYCYFTRGDYIRSLAWELWERASAAPPVARRDR